MIGTDWFGGALSAWHYGGCCVLALGLAMLALLWIVVNNTQFVRVPEGEPVDQFYRAWKRKKLKERLSKPLLAFVAAGFTLVSCGITVLIYGFMR